MIQNNNKKAFSILEVLVWIFIFSMWIISIYAVIITTLKLNDYNKNYIIASNLAREQIELVRNIRDTNYKKIQNYNVLNPGNGDLVTKFEFGKYYKIENDFSTSASFPIYIEEILNFWEWETELTWKMQNYTLCIDSENRYTYNCLGNNKTNFYKYIKIEEVEYNNAWREVIDDAFKVTSKVIWNRKWYHEFELKSIITDFKRL